MNRRAILITAVCLTLATGRLFGATDRPNVVFILVDDLGWADVKCFNPNTTYETPNVDQLAAEGVRFTDFYSGGPVCSQTRGSILLGWTPARRGITGFLTHPGRDPAYVRGQLPPEATTMVASLLGMHEGWRKTTGAKFPKGLPADTVSAPAPDAEAKNVGASLKIVAFGDSTTAPRKTVNLVYADRLLAERIAGQPEAAVATPMVPSSPMESVTLPLVDLDPLAQHHVLVDREPGQYLGHPTTCLLEDGKSMLCVYPKGHGRGAIVYKRSKDGGKTWSGRLPTPDSWSTSKEVPTLHRVIGPDGTKRIIMWSGLYPARLAVSEDDGLTWSELEKVGDWGGIVVMGFVEELQTGPGHYLAMFHDDGRFFKGGAGTSYDGVSTGKRTNTMTLYQTFSRDGGLTWSEPEAIYASSAIHLCEPGCIRSPDGKTLAVLLRENARRKNSHVVFSTDEGKSWSEPRELPLSLTGDRHTGKYGPDGRLCISLRCRSPKHRAGKRPFEGDWIGWIGTWSDIVNGTEGQYQVRCKDNTHGYDTSYPGVEILPDGTFVTTTYGHWTKGEKPYILSTRFKLSEIDEIARKR